MLSIKNKNKIKKGWNIEGCKKTMKKKLPMENVTFFALPSFSIRFFERKGKGRNKLYYLMQLYNFHSLSHLFTISICLSFSSFTLPYPSVSLQQKKKWKLWCDLMQHTTCLFSLLSIGLLQEREKRWELMMWTYKLSFPIWVFNILCIFI